MKKKIIFILILACFVILFGADLSKLYKNGKADFKIDESFGKNTEWDMIFPMGVLSITFKKNGSFFATSLGGKSHSVFYFSNKGKLIKKIGQKGEGPGDFYHPGNLSILDDKYLIIGEYPSKRRISVFDLKGNFVKILRVRGRSCFGPTAISNGKLVYYSYGRERDKGNFTYRKINIYIKDVKSGKEKKFDINFEDKEKKLRGQGSIGLTQYLSPELFFKKISDNKILCAFSSEPQVYILGLNGKIFKTFNIKLKKNLISEKTKTTIYRYFHRMYKKEGGFIYNVLKRMRKNKTLFRDYYPLYSKITVDNDNILFWEIIKGVKYNKENDVLEIGSQIIYFLKYSKEGKFLSRHSIDLSDNKEINFNPEFIFKNAAYVYSDEKGLQRILLN